MSGLIEATIVAQEIKPPSGTSKSVGVKAADGTYFSYWQDGSIRMEQGATYKIGYVEKPGNNGNVFRNIKSAEKVAQSVAQAAAPAVARVTNGHANSDDARVVPAHVSNWVAHAITAGFISSPDQMVTWAQWAMEAARKMNTAPAWQGNHPDDLPEMRG